MWWQPGGQHSIRQHLTLYGRGIGAARHNKEARTTDRIISVWSWHRMWRCSLTLQRFVDASEDEDTFVCRVFVPPAPATKHSRQHFGTNGQSEETTSVYQLFPYAWCSYCARQPGLYRPTALITEPRPLTWTRSSTRNRATRLSVEITQLRNIPFAINKWLWSIYTQGHCNCCF